MLKNRSALALLKFLFTVFAVILAGRAGLKAEAAVFTHVHTPSCYTQVTKTCTNHDLVNEYGSMEKHCWTCGCMRDMHVSIWWDVCRNGLVGNRDVSYYISCNSCGTPWRQDGPPSTSSHTYTATDIVCGMTEASPSAYVNLNVADASPTNGEVTVCADVSISDGTFSLDGVPYNFGGGYTGDSSIKVSDNGPVSVTVRSSDGREVSATVNVTNIDKTPPSVTSIDKSTSDWTESGLTITVNAGDGESGLAGAAYSFNGSPFGASNSFNVTSNGTVSVRVMDAAGNITEDSIAISNIGRDPEVVRREQEEAARKQAEEEAAKRAEEEAKRQAEAKALEAKKQEEAKKQAEVKKQAENAKKQQASKEEEQEKLIKETKLLAKSELEKDNSNSVSENSVSQNELKADVSAGEDADLLEGGKLIRVTDLTGEKYDLKEIFDIEDNLEEVSEESSEVTEDTDPDMPPLRIASAGNLLYKAGPFLLALGLLFFSFFNYIYVSVEGSKRIVTLAKIKYERDRTIVCIKKGALKSHGRYLIFYSLTSRIRLKKKKPVYVKIGDNESFIKADEGIAFKY